VGVQQYGDGCKLQMGVLGAEWCSIWLGKAFQMQPVGFSSGCSESPGILAPEMPRKGC